MRNIQDLYLHYCDTNLESDFDTLYRALWKLCVTIVGKHPDAEDIASEVAIPLGIKLCKRQVYAKGLYTLVVKQVNDMLVDVSKAAGALKRGGEGRIGNTTDAEKQFCTRCQAEGHDIESHFESSQFDPFFHPRKCDPSVDPYELSELPPYLTEQERRLVEAVSYGHTLREWAKKEGLSYSTANRMRNEIIAKACAKSV